MPNVGRQEFFQRCVGGVSVLSDTDAVAIMAPKLSTPHGDGGLDNAEFDDWQGSASNENGGGDEPIPAGQPDYSLSDVEVEFVDGGDKITDTEAEQDAPAGDHGPEGATVDAGQETNGGTTPDVDVADDATGPPLDVDVVTPASVDDAAAPPPTRTKKRRLLSNRDGSIDVDTKVEAVEANTRVEPLPTQSNKKKEKLAKPKKQRRVHIPSNKKTKNETATTPVPPGDKKMKKKKKKKATRTTLQQEQEPTLTATEPTLTATVDDGFAGVDTRPRCSRCGDLADPLRAQLVGKCQGYFICPTCNSRGVMLSRVDGFKTFQKTFKSFTRAEKELFWKDCGTAKGTPQLMEVVEKHRSRLAYTDNSSSVGGGYYPLTWYKKNGFPWKRIRARCTDTKEHRLLGTCYRVDVETFAKVNGERDQIEERLGSCPRAPLTAPVAAPVTTPEQKALASITATAKASAKAKAAAKASASAKLKNATTGKKMLAKIAHPKLQLESALQTKRLLKKVPGFIVENSTDSVKALDKIRMKAQAAIDNGNDLDISATDVQHAVDKAMANYSHLNSTIAAAKSLL
jgi:hypothetical protein